MVKFSCTCLGRRVQEAKVSLSFAMWWSRDRLSAMKLNFPRICWLYSAESVSINSWANHRAVLS